MYLHQFIFVRKKEKSIKRWKNISYPLFFLYVISQIQWLILPKSLEDVGAVDLLRTGVKKNVFENSIGIHSFYNITQRNHY